MALELDRQREVQFITGMTAHTLCQPRRTHQVWEPDQALEVIGMIDDYAWWRQEIVLSVQGALLGNVTHNLRGVAADWSNTEIRIVCYFHGPISDDDQDTMSCVHTEVATDFVDIVPVHFTLERLDMPMKMNGFRAWVFLRKE
jgi:hypothetical protein